MTVYDLLKEATVRISTGSKRLVYEEGIWYVYQNRYQRGGVKQLYFGDSESTAVKIMLED